MNIREKKFIDKFIEKRGNDLEYVSGFVNTHADALFKCKKCNGIFSCKPHNLLNNNRNCTLCGPKKQRKFKDFKIFVENIDGYTLLSSEDELKGSSGKFSTNMYCSIFHKDCGSITSVRINHFWFDGIRCTNCKSNKKKTTAEISDRIERESSGQFRLISEYNGLRKKIVCECQICHNTVEDTPTNFMVNKRGCPFCGMSKSERLVLEYCKMNSLDVVFQKKFENLKYKLPLKFDFSINNILLECDGEFHFNETCPDKFINNIDTYKERDSVKNNYAIENNLTLIRIFNKDINIDFLEKIKNSSTTIETFNDYENILIIKEGKELLRRGLYNKVEYTQASGNVNQEDIVLSASKDAAAN